MSSPCASRSNSTLGSQKYLTKSQEAKLQLQGQGGAAILPTQPAPVFVYTQERTTPHPPPSTELLDLDPNSPRARGLCHKYNIKVVSDDSIGDRTGMVAKVVQAILKPRGKEEARMGGSGINTHKTEDRTGLNRYILAEHQPQLKRREGAFSKKKWLHAIIKYTLKKARSEATEEPMTSTFITDLSLGLHLKSNVVQPHEHGGWQG
ncbi:uncharacterized protein LACBIDRAFT_334156 [Laccaria bicolor S238N-H82]|uniref:Predicted protein n=1 Tax=Laccaria bicolor (strain S238N-H82 / ATCC MYA-4686) TaxID=486041 RepID=B0DY94_LACBS|nr:uncharacterized protein LACBIDRAFT_334156 [Laccaria bicolor S238N-H82]EDR00350.1 predicted protein [Laccaria bicolor S238N-H82]|eukprot:XP_001888909.1 predicted protein [Laccaria bicolor S238N-H82]